MLNSAGVYPDILLDDSQEAQLKYLCGKRPRPKDIELALDMYCALIQHLNGVSQRCMRAFRAVTRSCQPNSTWADYMYSHAGRTDDIPARTCTVYFAAQKNGAHYRCSQSEDDNDDVISSVVATVYRGERAFGRIDHFIHCRYDSTEHELACMKWFGIGIRCEHTEMYEVRPDGSSCVSLPRLVPVNKLSAPLLHAWEGNVLWIPCCL